MKNCLAIILLAAATSFAQVSLTQGPKVNDVGLGSTKDEVVRKFGKPLSEAKRDAGECIGGTEMTLKYPGLKFVLYDDPDDATKLTVGEFEITSAKWVVSGTRIGDTTVAVNKLFGTRSVEEEEAGAPVWIYYMDENISPGSTNFHFRNGKLVKIVSLWQMC
jgi:hypothetical protein